MRKCKAKVNWSDIKTNEIKVEKGDKTTSLVLWSVFKWGNERWSGIRLSKAIK